MEDRFVDIMNAIIAASKKRANYNANVGFKNLADFLSSIEKTNFNWKNIGYSKEPSIIGKAFAKAISIQNNRTLQISNDSDLMFYPNVQFTSSDTFKISGCNSFVSFSPNLDFTNLTKLYINDNNNLQRLVCNKYNADGSIQKRFKPTYIDISNCPISEIDASEWDMSNCTNIKIDNISAGIDISMFVLTNLKVLGYLKASNDTEVSINGDSANNYWILNNLTNIQGSIRCNNATKVNIKNWGQLPKLTSIITGPVSSTNHTIKEIDLTGTNFGNATSITMFYNMYNVETITGVIYVTNANSLSIFENSNTNNKIKNFQLHGLKCNLTSLKTSKDITADSIHYLITNAQGGTASTPINLSLHSDVVSRWLQAYPDDDNVRASKYINLI